MEAERGLTGGEEEEEGGLVDADFDFEEESDLGSFDFERFLEDEESDLDFWGGRG